MLERSTRAGDGRLLIAARIGSAAHRQRQGRFIGTGFDSANNPESLHIAPLGKN